MYTIKNFNYIYMEFIQIKIVLVPTLFNLQSLDLASTSNIYELPQLPNIQDW